MPLLIFTFQKYNLLKWKPLNANVFFFFLCIFFSRHRLPRNRLFQNILDSALKIWLFPVFGVAFDVGGGGGVGVGGSVSGFWCCYFNASFHQGSSLLQLFQFNHAVARVFTYVLHLSGGDRGRGARKAVNSLQKMD